VSAPIDSSVNLAIDQVVDSADGQNTIVVQARNWVWNAGTLSWQRETQPGGGGGGLVTIGDGTHSPVAVKPASTAPVATDLALVVAISPNSDAQVQGDVASGAANSGNPLQDGGLASVGTAPTAVSSGQRVAMQLDKFGRVVVQVGAPLDRQEQNALILNNTTASTQVFAAGGGVLRHAITHIHVSNTSGVACRIDVLDGSTLLWSDEAAAAGGGAGEDFTALPLLGSAATALNVQCSVGVSDIRVTIVGYQTP
jgi:hypothetical protein